MIFVSSLQWFLSYHLSLLALWQFEDPCKISDNGSNVSCLSFGAYKINKWWWKFSFWSLLQFWSKNSPCRGVQCYPNPCIYSVYNKVLVTEKLSDFPNIKKYMTNTHLSCFNPKPHGSRRICPHFFKGLYLKKSLIAQNRQKISIPWKTSAESLSWVMYP
jgi:hypothetical protein